jgi:hypothetical protein
MKLSNMNIQNWKNRLIERLYNTKDIAVLQEVETALKKPTSLEERIFKPMRKTITVEELEKEQNYKPMTAEAFFKEVDAIGLNENIDELLKMLD